MSSARFRIRETTAPQHGRRSFDIILTSHAGVEQCIRSQLAPYGPGEAERIVEEYLYPLRSFDATEGRYATSQRLVQESIRTRRGRPRKDAVQPSKGDESNGNEDDSFEG